MTQEQDKLADELRTLAINANADIPDDSERNRYVTALHAAATALRNQSPPAPDDVVGAACRAFGAYLSVEGWGDAPLGEIDDDAIEKAMSAALSASPQPQGEGDQYRKAVIALRRDLMDLPPVPSSRTLALLAAMRMNADGHDLYAIGKRLQREHGGVPFKTEYECAAGRWHVMTAPLRTPATPSVDRLVEAATKARDKFLHYELLHRLKCTSEGDEKADRNREMADMLTEALASIQQPEEGEQ